MADPLSFIGLWNDSDEGASWINPRFLVDHEWASDCRSDFVRYLQSGVRVHEYMGYSHCRFRDGPPDQAMGNADLSDGVWLWPEGLHVYVARYHVRLPREFLNHVRDTDFAVPSNLDAKELAKRDVSTAFWQDWCKTQKRWWWSICFWK